MIVDIKNSRQAHRVMRAFLFAELAKQAKDLAEKGRKLELADVPYWDYVRVESKDGKTCIFFDITFEDVEGAHFIRGKSINTQTLRDFLKEAKEQWKEVLN